MLKFEGEKNKHEKGHIVINKIFITARNLTSNVGIFLLFENARTNGIFELIDTDLAFDNESTNKIKMNHVKTLLCGHFIGIDRLERLKLLQGDPLVNEFGISVKEPETVSRFLGNFSYKTTQMLIDINFKVFKGLLYKSKLTSITIDIYSSVSINNPLSVFGSTLPSGQSNGNAALSVRRWGATGLTYGTFLPARSSVWLPRSHPLT